MPKIDRRAVIRAAALVPLIGVSPALAHHAEAEPLADLISAYRAECAAINAYEGDLENLQEDCFHEAFNALNNVESFPAGQSKGVALDALRLALEIEDGMMGTAAVPNLVQAALTYFEGA